MICSLLVLSGFYFVNAVNLKADDTDNYQYLQMILTITNICSIISNLFPDHSTLLYKLCQIFFKL